MKNYLIYCFQKILKKHNQIKLALIIKMDITIF